MTPAAIVDRAVLKANCARMRTRAAERPVVLRPHLKTAKCAEIARTAHGGLTGPIAVSTIAEIAYFGEAGFRDITYAVGIAAAKVPALVTLQRQYGLRITLLADSAEAITEAGRAANVLGASFPLLIEIDCGARRAGVDPDAPELLHVGKAAAATAGVSLAGVLTHAGHSYHAHSKEELADIATSEVLLASRAANRLRQAGHMIETVSIGSTPTALQAVPLDGITEVRPGVYMFFDLTQAALGVCRTEDIALSVLTTVIGHNPHAGHVLIDAGALALSKDRGAEDLDAGTGYGLVIPATGGPPTGAWVADVHQEHGMVRSPSPGALFTAMPVGSRWRILPNHACMTAAPYPRYHVVAGSDAAILNSWDKCSGW